MAYGMNQVRVIHFLLVKMMLRLPAPSKYFRDGTDGKPAIHS